MMRWGKKKPVSSSWFTKLNGSSDLKPAKENNQDDEKPAKPSLSSTKHQNDILERSKRFQRVSVEKESTATRSADMESNEKFEEIKEAEAIDRDKGTVIMTPRIQLNGEKQRCERRDHRLLKQKPNRSEQDTEVNQWQMLKETKLSEVKHKADQQRKSMYLRRELNRLGTKESNTASGLLSQTQ